MVLDETTRRFLEEPRFAVPATLNADGSPQQTVMWYDLVGDRLLMNTARGRAKEANLRRDGRASVCVEDGYRYVTLSGRIELDADPETSQRDIARLAARYHGPERAAEMVRDQFARQRRISLRLRIERVDAHGFGDGA